MTNTDMTVEDALQVLTQHGINGVTFEKLLKIRADSTPLCTCGNENHFHGVTMTALPRVGRRYGDEFLPPKR